MDPIVSSVVKRWKSSSSNSWLGDAPDDIDLDSVAGYAREDIRLVKGFKAKCSYLSGVYRSLAEPLEAPKLAVYADRMDQQVIQVEQIMGMISMSRAFLPSRQLEKCGDPR